MKNFKTIVKFTMKDLFFRKTFLTTNIIMMLVVIFLSKMVIKIGNITDGYVESATQEIVQSVDNIYDIETEVKNENIDNIKDSTKASVNKTLGKTFNSGFVIAFILFFSIYFYGYMVSNSIAQEKTSRVIETLIVSTSPESIVLGKTVAMGILGIGQMFFLLLVAALSLGDKLNIKIMDMFKPLKISFSNISLGFKDFSFNGFNGFKNFIFNDYSLSNGLSMPIIILLFFIFGYLFYAFICAIAGAGVSKAEDIQLVNGPISIMAMIGFYMAAFTTSMPDSKWTPWVKFLPVSSAFAMPSNMINGTVTNMELLLSLLILVLSALWLAFMSIKVYKYVIFNYGNRTKIKDIIKIIFLHR